MSFEWQTCTLGSLIKHKKGLAFKSKDYQDSGVPVIRVSNFSDNTVSKNDLKFVSEAVAAESKDVELIPYDIVVATVGSWPNNPSSVVGRSVSIPSWAKGALMNQNAVILRAKSGDIYDQRFIYYQTRTEAFSHHVVSKAQGSANQASITLDVIFSFPVFWPEFSIRKEIAHFLNAIDDRIALLRETNATLEAIAQALFKSWFVDFDPVHANAGTQAPSLPAEIQALFPSRLVESPQGLIPEGWEVGKVDDLLELAYGKALKATDRIDGDVPVYGSGGITGAHNQALVNPPSIIVGRKGTVGSLYWEDRPFFPIDTVFYVRTEKSLVYCFYLLQTLGLKDMNTDGAVPGLNRNNVYRLPVVIPSNTVLKAFDETVATIREKIFTNNKQADFLTALRDTLLPRLISGQLRLPEAEAALAEMV